MKAILERKANKKKVKNKSVDLKISKHRIKNINKLRIAKKRDYFFAIIKEIKMGKYYLKGK